MLPWTLFTFLIALVWLRRHLDLNRGKREPVLSPDLAAGSPESLPTLTILVAAKDEQANIGTCLQGLCAQQYPALQIIAMNDRSTDRTPQILDDFAARDPRVTAVHIRDLPPGWMGKHNAMHTGVQHATGQLLCFTDADCRYHDPHLLAAAVRSLQQRRVDFLSVLPLLEAHTLWERVVQPPAGGIMIFWFPPGKVNSPASPIAYANGAFMLMSRHAYDTLGGHTEVRQAFNEDMVLARMAKQRGLRLFVIQGGGLLTVRMYVGFRQVWKGWSRIFYGVFQSVARLLLSAAFLAVFSVSPYVTLLLSPLAGDAAWPLAAAGATAIAAQQSLMWRFYAFLKIPPWWALTYPLGAALCVAMMVNSLTRYLGRKTDWRGTAYRGHPEDAGKV